MTRTMSEERREREENCSLAAASLFVVVIAVGENWKEEREQIVNQREKSPLAKRP